MSQIWYFHPANYTLYRRVLLELTPILDREGLSFHIARPEETPSSEEDSIYVTLGCERGCKE